MLKFIAQRFLILILLRGLTPIQTLNMYKKRPIPKRLRRRKLLKHLRRLELKKLSRSSKRYVEFDEPPNREFDPQKSTSELVNDMGRNISSMNERNRVQTASNIQNSSFQHHKSMANTSNATQDQKRGQSSLNELSDYSKVDLSMSSNTNLTSSNSTIVETDSFDLSGQNEFSEVNFESSLKETAECHVKERTKSSLDDQIISTPRKPHAQCELQFQNVSNSNPNESLCNNSQGETIIDSETEDAASSGSIHRIYFNSNNWLEFEIDQASTPVHKTSSTIYNPTNSFDSGIETSKRRINLHELSFVDEPAEIYSTWDEDLEISRSDQVLTLNRTGNPTYRINQLEFEFCDAPVEIEHRISQDGSNKEKSCSWGIPIIQNVIKEIGSPKKLSDYLNRKSVNNLSEHMNNVKLCNTDSVYLKPFEVQCSSTPIQNGLYRLKDIENSKYSAFEEAFISDSNEKITGFNETFERTQIDFHETSLCDEIINHESKEDCTSILLTNSEELSSTETVNDSRCHDSMSKREGTTNCWGSNRFKRRKLEKLNFSTDTEDLSENDKKIAQIKTSTSDLVEDLKELHRDLVGISRGYKRYSRSVGLSFRKLRVSFWPKTDSRSQIRRRFKRPLRHSKERPEFNSNLNKRRRYRDSTIASHNRKIVRNFHTSTPSSKNLRLPRTPNTKVFPLRPYMAPTISSKQRMNTPAPKVPKQCEKGSALNKAGRFN